MSFSNQKNIRSVITRFMAAIMVLCLLFAGLLQTQATASEGTVSADQVSTALRAVQSELDKDPNSQGQSQELSQYIPWADENTEATDYAEVLAYLTRCTQAIEKGSALPEQAKQTAQLVGQCQSLPDNVKQTYIAALETIEVSSLGSLISELLGNLKTLKAATDQENPEQTLVLPGMRDTDLESYESEVQNQAAGLSNVEKLMEVMPQWESACESLDAVENAINANPNAQAVLTDAGHILDQKTKISQDIEKFFALSPEKQKLVTDEIADADTWLDTFYVSSVIKIADETAALNRQCLQLQQTSPIPLVLVILLLVFSVLAVAVGTVSIVFSLRKPKNNGMTDSIEDLTRQTKILSDHVTKMEPMVQNVNQMNAKLQKLESSQKKAAEQPSVPPVQTWAEKKPVKEEPSPVKPIPPTKKEVCRLMLSNYRPEAKGSTCSLKENPNGDYVLYSDNTLGIKKNIIGLTSSLDTWQTNGLMYLFGLESNGNFYTADSTNLPKNNFMISSMVCPAQVEVGYAGEYKLVKAGQLSITRF